MDKDLTEAAEQRRPATLRLFWQRSLLTDQDNERRRKEKVTL